MIIAGCGVWKEFCDAGAMKVKPFCPMILPPSIACPFAVALARRRLFAKPSPVGAGPSVRFTFSSSILRGCEDLGNQQRRREGAKKMHMQKARFLFLSLGVLGVLCDPLVFFLGLVASLPR